MQETMELLFASLRDLCKNSTGDFLLIFNDSFVFSIYSLYSGRLCFDLVLCTKETIASTTGVISISNKLLK